MNTIMPHTIDIPPKTYAAISSSTDTTHIVAIILLTLAVKTSFFFWFICFITLYTRMMTTSVSHESISSTRAITPRAVTPCPSAAAVHGATSILTMPSPMANTSIHCRWKFFLIHALCSPFMYTLSWNMCMLYLIVSQHAGKASASVISALTAIPAGVIMLHLPPSPRLPDMTL